ncbi:hypothetical protein HELRODRAFT_170233 [Helobdella robusta]|uniref:SUEL-type lectin domain-containing protein n=1 Tax=Helobdella robusta TaxID=6412 RepID=T1F2T3_HELRO|nr:hypothetical protein HELRODRAFT_170233 [Helobdella robusta]ESO07698.1 hypothetical protein HELRODRAFT_170233 [Helobdella robusta]
MHSLYTWKNLMRITNNKECTPNEHAESVQETICQSHYFRPKCPSVDDVIIVEKARYGRLEKSKCVTQAFDYINCFEDVLHVMDSFCSNRRSCEVRILDENFNYLKPCHEDLKSNLDVQYRCVAVLTIKRPSMRNAAANATCLTAHVNTPRGYIAASPSSSFTSENSQRNSSLHSRFANRYQQHENNNNNDNNNNNNNIDATNSNDNNFNNHNNVNCRKYGDIYENVAEDASEPFSQIDDKNFLQHKTSICPSTSRVTWLYRSTSNLVKVQLLPRDFNKQMMHASYLVHFEVIGCANMEPLPSMHMERRGDVLLVSCLTSSVTWYMHCRHGQWIGEWKNCSDLMTSSEAQRKAVTIVSSGALLVVLVCSTTFVIGMIVVLVGAALLKKWPKSSHSFLLPSSQHPNNNNIITSTLSSNNTNNTNNNKTSNSTLRKETIVTYGMTGSSDLISLGFDHVILQTFACDKCCCEYCSPNKYNTCCHSKSIKHQQQQSQQQQQLQQLRLKQQQLSYKQHFIMTEFPTILANNDSINTDNNNNNNNIDDNIATNVASGNSRKKNKHNWNAIFYDINVTSDGNDATTFINNTQNDNNCCNSNHNNYNKDNNNLNNNFNINDNSVKNAQEDMVKNANCGFHKAPSLNNIEKNICTNNDHKRSNNNINNKLVADCADFYSSSKETIVANCCCELHPATTTTATIDFDDEQQHQQEMILKENMKNSKMLLVSMVKQATEGNDHSTEHFFNKFNNTSIGDTFDDNNNTINHNSRIRMDAIASSGSLSTNPDTP